MRTIDHLARALLPLLASLSICAAPNAAFADDCNPDFGVKLYEWVLRDSVRQALALAEKDFASRATNGRIVEYDDLRTEAIKIATVLDAYAEQSRKESEALGGKPPDLSLAVTMQAETADALTSLAAVGAKLDGMRQRLAILAVEPTMERFVIEGAHHVGRSTLLESITPLARGDAFSLNARYSFYVQVEFDGAGNAKKVDGSLSGNEYTKAADGTAITVLTTSPEPFSKAIAAAYLFIRGMLWSNEVAECNAKIRVQEKRAAEAMALLAEILPSASETFKLYDREQRGAQRRFGPVQVQFEQARTTLDDRWRGLMAVNLARANLAASVLTAEKLEVLRKAYDTADPLARLFDSARLTSLLVEVGTLQSSIINRELQVATSCTNASGLRAAEDLVDAKRVGTSVLSQLQAVAAFAPVLPTISQVRQRIERPAPRAQAILQGAASADCAQTPQILSSNVAPTAVRVLAARRDFASATTKRRASVPLAKQLKSSFGTVAYARTFTTPWTICGIFRDGRTYRCRGSDGGAGGNGSGEGAGGGGGGPPLRGELGNGVIPRYADVSIGGKDGGFSADSAVASATVDAARANIDRRIQELTSHQAEIEQAMPAWLTSAEAGTSAAVGAQRAKLGDEGTFRTQFFNAHQAAMQQTADRLNRFAQVSGDNTGLTQLVKESGVVDTTLSDVPTSALVPDLPPISGVLPASRYPAGASLMQQRVARESAKGAPLQGEARTTHDRMLKAATKFAGAKNPNSDVMAEALLQDALVQRFSQGGVLGQSTISVISDTGVISRVPYTGGPPPPNSILARAEIFENNSRVVAGQNSISRQALSSDAADRDVRLRVLQSSEDLLAVARTEFYGGSVAQGEGLLTAAGLLADLVTSFTPGVSWGRDIYESVTGKDLISGRTLEKWERGAAILGAITVGVGSAAPKVIHAFRALERAGIEIKRAEHLVDTARRIDSGVAKPGIHAIRQMTARGISVDEVEDVLNTGSRFYDVVEGGIVAVETGLSAGAKRLVVVVDPDKLVDAENMLIRTAYRNETRTDAKLVEAMIQGTNDRRRYIPLPDSLD